MSYVSLVATIMTLSVVAIFFSLSNQKDRSRSGIQLSSLASQQGGIFIGGAWRQSGDRDRVVEWNW